MKSIILAVSALIASNSSLLAQAGGPLTPPGPPGLTMKSLDQVQPRTPIVNGAAGVTISGSGNVTISASGSYYLTGNRTVTSGTGITVSASNVTIDLQGFTLDGSSSAADAISSSSYHNLTVSNGCIRNWTGTGVSTGNTGSHVSHLSIQSVGTAISLFGQACTVDSCRVMFCKNGIDCSNANAVVTNCSVYSLTSSAGTAVYGIRAGSVVQCNVGSITVSGAGDAIGISATHVTNCSVSAVNTSGGTNCRGISATSVVGSTVSNASVPAASSATYYGISASSAHQCVINSLLANTSSPTYGIYSANVSECVVTKVSNSGAGTSVMGIRGNSLSNDTGSVVETSVIRGCNVSGIIASSGSAYGINVSGSAVIKDNRVGYCGYRGISATNATITGNVTNNCVTGIALTTGLATGNTSISDSTAFSFSATVRSGPTVVGGGVGTTFDPNANFDL